MKKVIMDEESSWNAFCDAKREKKNVVLPCKLRDS